VDFFLSKLQRFVRLWRALKISIYKLDQLLWSLVSTMSTPDINQSIYEDLVSALIISDKLGIPTDRLSTWWSPINTIRYPNIESDRQEDLPSLYDNLFRSKSVLNPPDAAFNNVSTSGVPTFASTDTYGLHTAAITAALGIKEEELTALLQALAISSSATISLTNLSWLFAAASIAKGFQLSIADYTKFAISIVQTQDTSFSLIPGSGTVAGQLGYLNLMTSLLADIKSSGFTLDEIIYLLNDDDPRAAYIEPAATIQLFYEGLRKELQKIQATDNSTNKPILLENAILQHFAANFSVSAEVSRYLLHDLLKFLNHSSTPLSISLLEALTDPNFINGIYDLDYGSVIGSTSSTLSPYPNWDLDEIYYSYYHIDKITLIINRLRIRKDELNSLNSHFSALLITDLTSFPVKSADPDLKLDEFIRYIQWIQLRDRLSIASDDFVKLTNTSLVGNKPGWKALIIKITDWNSTLIDDLTGVPTSVSDSGYLHTDFPANYFKPEFIDRLADVMDATNRIGLVPKQLIDSLHSTIVIADANKIMNAARAKHTEEDWLNIAKPLNDVLREKQRQALVAYVIANPGSTKWRNENEVYAYLLIDVEMKPCMMTSRIKQAISTVQLFIDRVIMNLEFTGGVTSTPINLQPQAILEWKKWRKWYRIWEANRKIFLYPENWIQPELRDNKTPFFKELENQLLQDEVKADKVEQAYFDYLEKLDEVARLDCVTSFHELDAKNGIDIIHVIGRTHSHPQHYFYRKFEQNQWTAWEKMNIEVKGDHVVLVVWNRRLHIYWLTFIEKSPSTDEVNDVKNFISTRLTSTKVYLWRYWVDVMNFVIDDNITNNRLKYWNIMLNWSEYKEGKWQAPKIAKDTMELKPYKISLNTRNLQTFSSLTGFWGSSTSSAYLSALGYLGSIGSLGAVGYPQGDIVALLNILTNRNEIKIHELFKNKLYLLPIINPNNELTLNMCFGGGMDEYNISMHSFLCKDGSTEPIVYRDLQTPYQFLAPVSSLTNKMKFYQSPLPPGYVGSTGTLNTDGYQWMSGIVLHYDYPIDFITGSGASDMPVHALDQIILNKIPNGPFRISARSDMMYNGDVHEIKPIEDDFFFDDDYNTFFVRQVKIWQSLNQIQQQASADMTLSAIADSYNDNYIAEFSPSIPDPVTGGQPVFDTASLSTNTLNGYYISKYYFQTFFHPHIHQFIKALNQGGIDGLLTIDNQDVVNDTLHFISQYQPTGLVINKDKYLFPTNVVEFGFSEAYSNYNWELFFHIPMIVAQSLSTNQQFEDAQKWYHYVFNPTSNTGLNNVISYGKERFWKFRPFYEEATVGSVLSASFFTSFSEQIAAWQANPFQPHLIARMRIVTYMKNVVMKYIDNLIAWGDQLFRRNTLESINEAIQLYILASNILGPRPQDVPARAIAGFNDFNELIATGPLDDFSNALVKIESFLDPNAFPGTTSTSGNASGMLKMQFFCLANNQQLLAYWDLVADRLFKIRNCMNIDGIVQQLPLFEPPIDPALLVRAAAAGIDINSIIDENAGIGTPNYRFVYMLQKANELVADVRSLGASFLSILEKNDAEQLALLRSGQEIDLLDKITFIKESQVNDAKSALDAIQKNIENTTHRYQYYSSRAFMNTSESIYFASLAAGAAIQGIQAGVKASAVVLSLIPQFHGQGPAAIGVSEGGSQLAASADASAGGLGIASAITSVIGSMSSTIGSYQRRQDDWTFQAETAQKELEQLDKQIISAQIRIDIAERELSNHLKQLENSQSVDEFMRRKFTSQELYSWMVSQVAGIYFQSYQLAYDLAVKVENCYNYELPLAVSKKPVEGFIKFGSWDSLRKGLLSGERLQYDLRKIEHSYLEENKRYVELTKHVSLATLNPNALLDLITGKLCSVTIPEWLFDLDYPGHYMRRIKSVSISIPCIAGPYTTISCKLTLNGSKYRKVTTLNGSIPLYVENTGSGGIDTGTTDRFVRISSPKPSIAMSHAQNDSGIFELSFRDERYLHFEGFGAISDWTLELPSPYAQFDYGSISDVIFHISYTAIDGGPTFAGAASTFVTDLLASNATNNGFLQGFNLRREFSSEWNSYSNSFGSGHYSLKITLNESSFPFYCKGKIIELGALNFILPLKASITSGTSYHLELTYLVSGIITTTIPPIVLTPSSDGMTISGSINSLTISSVPFTIQGNERIIKLALIKTVGSASTKVNADELVTDLYMIAACKITGAYTNTADDLDWDDTNPPFNANLQGWWRSDRGITLQGGSVANWVDQSGNGRNVVPLASVYKPGYSHGVVENAIGQNGFLKLPANLNLGTKYTLSFVCRPDISGHEILGKSGIYDTGISYGMYFDTTSNIYHYPSLAFAFSPITMSFTTIQSFVIERNDQIATLYINGVIAATATSTTNPDLIIDNLFGEQVGYGFVGGMYDVLLYNKVLTNSEKAELFNYINRNYNV